MIIYLGFLSIYNLIKINGNHAACYDTETRAQSFTPHPLRVETANTFDINGEIIVLFSDATGIPNYVSSLFPYVPYVAHNPIMILRYLLKCLDTSFHPIQSSFYLILKTFETFYPFTLYFKVLSIIFDTRLA